MLTHVDGNIALGRVGALVEQIAMLRQRGHDVVLITSGAISTGQHRMRRTMTLGTSIRDSAMNGAPKIDQAAAAAVGQSLIMSMYENFFAKYNMTCAQVLFTEEDVNDSHTLAQVCESTMELLQLGVVPIVNENDAVTSRKTPVYDASTDEVQWDNDVLASKVSIALRADLLITLTDMAALYTAARDGEAAERVHVYRDGLKLVRTACAHGRDDVLSDGGRGKFSGRTRMSTNGLQALVEATRDAVSGGVRAAVVTSGHMPLALIKVLQGEDVGTLFVPTPSSAAAASTAGARSKL